MNSIEKTLIDRITSYHQSVQIPFNGTSFLVAFSGGSDSTALLYLYHTLARSNPFRLSACYVNHHLRSEAELREELELINKHISDLDLPLFTVDLDLNRPEYKKQSPEEAARNGRLSALESVRAEHGFDYIIEAHHLGDQLETMIQRIFQNGSIAGLSGIPATRDRIIRPLLSVDKMNVLSYLESKKLAYSHDSSNSKDIYLRNQIRTTVVPAIEKVFPQFGNALTKLAREIEDVKTSAAKEAECIEYDIYENLVLVGTQSFFSADPYIRKTFLLSIFNRLNKGLQKEGYRLPDRFLKNIYTADSSSPSLNTSGHGMTCLFSKERIYLFNDQFPEPPKPFSCPFKDQLEWTFSGVRIELGLNRHSDKDHTMRLPNPENERFILRSINPGDTLMTASGTKKVFRFLQEKQIPSFFRQFYAVLELHGKVLALLPGFSFLPIFDETWIKFQFKGDFSSYFYYISY